MGVEDGLNKIFELRERQVEIKGNQDADSQKEIEAINRRTSKLLSPDKKVGRERMNKIRELAGAENIFRKQLDVLSKELGISMESGIITREMENDRRYLTAVVDFYENGQTVQKFFKALKPQLNLGEYERDQGAFAREVETMRFLKGKNMLPVLDIVKSNTIAEQGLMYSLIDTLPEAKIGFIHGHEEIKKLKSEHAREAIDQLFKLGQVKLPDDIDKHIPDVQDPFESYEGYRENVWNMLDNKEDPECTLVRPLDGKKDRDGNIVEEKFVDVLARRFNCKGSQMRKKVTELLRRWKDAVEKYDNGDWKLTHGDLSPNNMYVDKDDKVKLLDWEWTGKTKNELLAIIYDYGNLRARAFNNPEFQEALDSEIIEHFRQRGDEEAGKAIVSLACFRSSANLAGFFENYEPSKQELPEETDRREATERGIKTAFNVAGIKF